MEQRFQAGSEFQPPKHQVRPKAERQPQKIIPFSKIMSELKGTDGDIINEHRIVTQSKKKVPSRRQTEGTKKTTEKQTKKITVGDRSDAIRRNMYGNKSKSLTIPVSKRR